MGVGTEITGGARDGHALDDRAAHRPRPAGRGDAAGTHARDVGFLLAKGFAEGTWNVDCDYRVIEFGGTGIRASISRRASRCAASITELGVANVLFAAPPPGIDTAGARGLPERRPTPPMNARQLRPLA